MGHSFIDFRERNRMLNDIEIITVVHVILDATRSFSEPPDFQPTENIKAMLDSWNSLIDVYGSGTVNMILY